MSFRRHTSFDESAQKRAPRAISGIPKFRSGSDWDQLPDYDRLPDYALLGIGEVCVLTGMSRSALLARVKDGRFAEPSFHGKARVWSLGYVRSWCRQFAQSFEEGAQ